MEFTRIPSEYSALPGFLLESVPGFSESTEFHVVADNVDSPGVIVAALKNFLIRLEAGNAQDALAVEERASLVAAYQAFEAMASSADPNVENALVTEALLYLNCGKKLEARIAERLHPRSKALYDRWVAKYPL